MTQEQTERIIRFFNAALDQELQAEAHMDIAANDRTWHKWNSKSDYALGQQWGIDTVLDTLGYKLIRNDEGYAVDIVPQ